MIPLIFVQLRQSEISSWKSSIFIKLHKQLCVFFMDQPIKKKAVENSSVVSFDIKKKSIILDKKASLFKRKFFNWIPRILLKNCSVARNLKDLKKPVKCRYHWFVTSVNLTKADISDCLFKSNKLTKSENCQCVIGSNFQSHMKKVHELLKSHSVEHFSTPNSSHCCSVP